MAREEQVEAGTMLIGVCAALALRADVDPFLVRINAVLLALVAAPIALALYAGAGLWMKRRLLAAA
jgi:phage shock protein PspC (stress-responsive transcriptional regulator)